MSSALDRLIAYAKASTYGNVQNDARTVEKEIEELRAENAEIAELTEECFQVLAFLVPKGEMNGWWDTCALTSAKNYGDRLVEFGLYERHPDGVGRRWFYRRLENNQ